MLNKKQLTLISSDEKTFRISVDAAMAADLVREAMGGDDSDDDDDDDDGDANTTIKADGDDAADGDTKSVNVLRVNGNCLAKVVQFLEKHNEEPMTPIETPLGGNTFEEVMKQVWYREFVSDPNMDQDLLFDILTAANYMGIKPLLDLACLKMTFELNGKNAEEIRQILNLPEMTEEEERQAREEHRWIFEDNYA